MKNILQHAGLIAYAAPARTGVMQQRWARRLFLVAYSAYKTWIESGPVDRLKDLVPPGSTVVDVGANVGFFTLKFARWVGEQGQVIAIEPDLENFETLAAKIGAAGLERRVRLHQAAAAAFRDKFCRIGALWGRFEGRAGRARHSAPVKSPRGINSA